MDIDDKIDDERKLMLEMLDKIQERTDNDETRELVIRLKKKLRFDRGL